METFYLILLVPVIVALIARLKFKITITWIETGVQILLVSVILTGVWFAGTYSQTHDTEIWNGEVAAKVRNHGHYIRTYQCNCYTTCSGSGSNQSCTQHCSTCYEDHYTVDWFLKSNIGKIRLKYRDSLSRRVYKETDPAIYTAAYVGEPCSTENSYTNYIKAVPESIFNMKDTSGFEHFADLIPQYPVMYGKYHVDHVLAMGIEDIKLRDWNNYLAEKTKILGPAKQANVIFIIVNTADQIYRHALETAWLGGKKNDVIVMAGVTNYPKIDWVDTITLGQNAGNSLMTVEMRDELMTIGSIEDHVTILDTISKVIMTRFDRKPMTNYEYLKDDIEPPTWVMILAFILAFVLSAGLTWIFRVYDPFGSNRY